MGGGKYTTIRLYSFVLKNVSRNDLAQDNGIITRALVTDTNSNNK